ncbi:MAG: helix-turn-helix domain-containing protein, partial [Phycisphaeraceae bacterium]|nr:helix-turn-helix domain-containing protein [Phycisphaeraceae bacterium]
MTPQGRGQLKQAIEPANQLRLAQNGKRGWQYDWLIWSVGTGAIASLKGAEPIVLISLLAHANYQGHSWPSVKRIAAETGSNARTVQRALSSLVEHGRGVIRRLEPGHDNRRTATYVFQPFDPSDAPSIVVDFTSLGVTPVSPRGDTSVRGGVTPVSPRGDTSVTQTQVLNSEIELIVEKAGDDDELFNSSNPNQSQPDQNPATGGLFDDSEASQALIEGFEWDPRDARSLVQRYGHAAVIDAVKTVEFYQNHKIPVGGKQVKS